MTTKPKIKVDYMAHVEGEGTLDIVVGRWRTQAPGVEHLRAAALFRGLPAWASDMEAPDITARIAASARWPTR